jgi:hypothetical protein
VGSEQNEENWYSTFHMAPQTRLMPLQLVPSYLKITTKIQNSVSCRKGKFSFFRCEIGTEYLCAICLKFMLQSFKVSGHYMYHSP